MISVSRNPGSTLISYTYEHQRDNDRNYTDKHLSGRRRLLWQHQGTTRISQRRVAFVLKQWGSFPGYNGNRMTHWFSFWFYPLSSVLLVSAAIRLESGWTWPAVAGWLALGLLCWSLLEYALHRFVLHWCHRNSILSELQRRSHLVHHQEPRNPKLILVHPLVTLPVSAILFGLLLLALGSFFSASLFLVGIWLGFVYYEWVHYSVHTSTRKGFFLASQRHKHLSHHFKDERSCFGVTSPLWDWAFRTAGSPERLGQQRCTAPPPGS